MTRLTLFQLAPSPNSMKVRVALGFKELPHETVDIDPTDRQALIDLTGQPRVPILVHGDTKVFDSGAILRYLDANFLDSPRLYSADYAEVGAIETWELYARTDLAPPIGVGFGQYFEAERDPNQLALAGRLMNAATSKIEETLADGPWLMGERFTAADVVCASAVVLTALPDALAQVHEISRFFQENVHLGEGRECTRDWLKRVFAYDR